RDDSARLEAAREFWELRDPRTILTLVRVKSEEIVPTLTKITLMRTLIKFGPAAVPCLIDEVCEHARLVSEHSGLSVHSERDGWREAVVESDAGRLLVKIGDASIPLLEQLRTGGEWVGEAADALV